MDAITPDAALISLAVLAGSDFVQKLHETSLGRAWMECGPSANACAGEKSRILGAEMGTSRARRSAMRLNCSAHVVGRNQLGGFASTAFLAVAATQQATVRGLRDAQTK